MVACEQALCSGKKIATKGKGRGGERACRQTFEAAIPLSCNYPADHLSVRSLSVNQFCTWVTPRKINRKWAVFCSVWKQSEMEHEPHCRFCKKSLISGKRINKPFVLLVWFVFNKPLQWVNLECGRYRYHHDFSRTWSFEDKYKEIGSASITDGNCTFRYI